MTRKLKKKRRRVHVFRGVPIKDVAFKLIFEGYEFRPSPNGEGGVIYRALHNHVKLVGEYELVGGGRADIRTKYAPLIKALRKLRKELR